MIHCNGHKNFIQGDRMSTIPFNQVAYGLTQALIATAPFPIVSKRTPTTADKAQIGTTWIDTVNNQYYVLTSIVSNLANWQLLAMGAGSLDQLTATDATVAVPAAGNINVVGGGSTNINTTAAGSTLTVSVISSPSFAGHTTVATGLTATTGNIVASAGNITASGLMSAGTTITAGTGITSTTGNIVAGTGNINATAGSMSAGTSVSAGTTVTAGTGLTVSAFGAGSVVSSTIGVFSSVNGTAGQVLTSNGAGVAPSFQAAGGGGGSLTYTATSTSPYVVLGTDDYIGVTAAGAFSVELPNAPATGRYFVVKDTGGTAGTDNITVTTVGGAVTIDGATTFVMNTDYQSAEFIFNGTSYEIF
jgi:hypothetical protein